jgi:OOP family OmpA-OmpF porin
MSLVAGVALSSMVGCAEPEHPPVRHTSSPSSSAVEPELAGAWYQIYFDSNKVEIGERGRMIIKTVAYIVAHDSQARVTVIGKTDSVGSSASNLTLSQKRADQVRDALVAAGVPGGRIDTSWTGDRGQDVEKPNSAAEHRDRVVDITVVKPSR